MTAYDSDSSDGEEQDYTETEVLLGFTSKDPKGETISRLGGYPEWLDATKAPSPALARCKSCGDLMVLLLQLNGELPARFPGHDRRLYVFACRRKTCRRKEGCVRAVRGVRVSPGVAAQQVGPDKEQEARARPEARKTGAVAGSGLGEQLFGVKAVVGGGGNPFTFPTAAGQNQNPFAKPSMQGSANPFSKTPDQDRQKEEKNHEERPMKTQTGSTAETGKDSDLPKTFVHALSLNDAPVSEGTHSPAQLPEAWPPEAEQPHPYPISYLSEAEYETLDPLPAAKVPAAPPGMDIDSGDGGGKEDKEVFESAMDSTFQKFADRLAQNPDQAIRYEFGGHPLLYSRDDGVGALLASTTHGDGRGGGAKVSVSSTRGMPPCRNCGTARVFEVQLTPRAIEELEAEEDGLDGMDWGTIIVGVCERDCQETGAAAGEPSYLEDWVGVQWEELAAQR